MSSFFDDELELLGEESTEQESTGSSHAFKTAPVFTGDAFAALGPQILPQRALYGRVITQRATGLPFRPSIPRLYINTNAPFSALVCGVQGSGKSHSTSVLLESCLMSDTRLGTLPAPLSALVFHFDTAAGGGAVQPCEAAYLAALDSERGRRASPPSVTVLVLPPNVEAMRRVYAGLPSVNVEPLHFSPDDISGERLLAMMKVDENAQMPLYMEAIMSILRSMEANFTYTAFRDELKKQKFNPSQKAMLNLRLSLLDSCLGGGTDQNRVSSHFRQGQLTIIDLSSPFMDGSSACGFFDLILGLFVEADVNAAGKLVVLDEAHKYLSDTQSGSSSRLTDSLLSVIRQQRHLATRVVISTQEPTVVPSKFIDLCSFIIAHRFSSPKWLRLLADHVSAAGDTFDDLFAKIVALPTGQAIMFAPNGLSVRNGTSAQTAQSDSDSGVGSSDDTGTVAPIGQGYLHVQSRLRVTRDGGHSILAVADPEGTTRIGRVPGPRTVAAAGLVTSQRSMSVSGRNTWEEIKGQGLASGNGQVSGAGDGKQDPAGGFRSWGSASAGVSAGASESEHAQSGGAPAPAEHPAEARVSPGLRCSTEASQRIDVNSLNTTPLALAPPVSSPAQAAALAEQPALRVDSPSDSNPSLGGARASPKPPLLVFDLDGEFVRFRPLMGYVLSQISSPEETLAFQKIYRNLDTDACGGCVKGIIPEAIKSGLLLRAATKKRSVTLIPEAIYQLTRPVASPAAVRPTPPADTSTEPLMPSLVFDFAGELARFRPLIDYVRSRITTSDQTLTLRNICSGLDPATYGDRLSDVIAEAVQRGLLLQPKTQRPSVALVPGATYQLITPATSHAVPPTAVPVYSPAALRTPAQPPSGHTLLAVDRTAGTPLTAPAAVMEERTEEWLPTGSAQSPAPSNDTPVIPASLATASSDADPADRADTPNWVNSSARAAMDRSCISLEGGYARFVPLVRYLQGQAAHGFVAVKVVTIERRLGKDVITVIGDAKAAGVVQTVPDSAKPKIMLPADTSFALPSDLYVPTPSSD